MINELIKIITQESELFEQFLALLERQKEALVKNEIEELNTVTEALCSKLLESRKLDKQRTELVAQIARENEIEGDLTVATLLEFADASQANRLLELKELILGLNEKITETRNSNAMLINQSRDFISRTMKMLSKMVTPEHAYDGQGVSPTGNAAVMVDRRI